MSRVKRGFKARRRRKKSLKLAKGFVGGRRRIFRQAMETLRRALWYAFCDRRRRKREFRRLWINRIAAAAKAEGISYSRLMGGLKKAGVALDRKVLADIAVRDPQGFQALIHLVQP